MYSYSTQYCQYTGTFCTSTRTSLRLVLSVMSTSTFCMVRVRFLRFPVLMVRDTVILAVGSGHCTSTRTYRTRTVRVLSEVSGEERGYRSTSTTVPVRTGTTESVSQSSQHTNH